MMELSQSILSDLTVFSKYARYLPKLERRETYDEICDRYELMMCSKYPALVGTIKKNMGLVRDKKVLPSMRALQFAGPAIEKANNRVFNCAYLPADDYRSFSEIMFLLLGGSGVGYSVQYHHVDKLPEIQKPTRTRRFLVADSIEGWADAVKVLMKSYLGFSSSLPTYDFSDIREKGAILVTAGGKAPGAEPLKECLFQIQKILDRKHNGEKLKPIEVHSIICHIANAVLAGGIRRAALISLFSFDDEEMLACKQGNWWELNEHFGRSNNSAVILRNRIKEEEFKTLWKKIELSNSGEPGVYFTDDIEYGTNPCCEIALRPYSFCNLCDVNVSDIVSQADLNHRVSVATFFGTLQAGFTDFHYLRDVWKRTTEKDALIGVGMTGIGSGVILQYNLTEAAKLVKRVNEDTAKSIGINPAARTSTVKPAGTTSCVLGTASGVHAWHAEYYVRRIRLGKNEALYTYLQINHPELIEDDFFRPETQAIVCIPQKAPQGAILRTESALDLAERVKKFNLEWVRPGHRSGSNTNNVSATISIDKNRFYKNPFNELEIPEQCTKEQAEASSFGADEWEVLGQWMWDNKKTFNGLSVLPYDSGSYTQAPFTDITEEEYTEMIKHLSAVDLTKVIELQDSTDLKGEAACAGGACLV